MPKELVISATPHETRVAILEDGHLCEIYVEREKEFALVGSIYKGRVTRVLPGMQSAFVDIGLDSDAFLYVSDFLENLEEYDSIVTTVEGKVQKMEQQGGQVFTPSAGEAAPATEPPEVAPGSGEPAAQEAAIPHPQEAPPPAEQHTTPPASRPYEQRDHRGPRGGYGRGGRGRRGRWDNRRGRDRHSGRDFPPSKYAPPHEPEPPLPADYKPIILPGESLAKYKNRMPGGATPQPAPAETLPAGPTEAAVETPSASESAPEPTGTSPILSYPGVYVQEVPSAEHPVEGVSAGEPPKEEDSSNSVPPQFGGAPQFVAEEPAHPAEAHSAPHEPELTAEQAATLAEQFAEATREELADEEEELQASEAGGSAYPSMREDTFAEAESPSETEPLMEGSEEAEVLAEFGAEGSDSTEETSEQEAAEELAEEEAAAEPNAEPPQQLSARVQDHSRARFQRPMRRGGRRRSGPHHRGRMQHRPQAQRRPQLISEMLKSGQEIIVQIAKEPLGKKGARITSHVALPGRFLVYMPTVDHIGVSRKIGSAEERSRLRRLLSEMKGSYPGGFIVRTAAAGASDEEIRSDVEFLGRTWSEIKTRSEQRKAPAILHRDLNLVERILRDHLSGDYSSIWIDNEEEYAKVVEFVGRFQPKLVGRVKLYTKEAPIFEEFGIQQEIDKSLRPKVWLKSGGYIVINHTEALVAIDVNTGKFVGRGSTRLEDTIVKTNLEAVKEIVRQIRLRDLGGIIVIDFIDMEERRNRDKVMQALDDALRADKAPSKVLSFNEFGLVAITRKRTKQALERVLCQPCPYCTGSGMVKSIPTICYEIQSEARKMAPELDSQSLTLRVHPEIAKALKTRESSLVEELENATKKSVIIQSDPTLHWEQYDIY